MAILGSWGESRACDVVGRKGRRLPEVHRRRGSVEASEKKAHKMLCAVTVEVIEELLKDFAPDCTFRRAKVWVSTSTSWKLAGPHSLMWQPDHEQTPRAPVLPQPSSPRPAETILTFESPAPKAGAGIVMATFAPPVRRGDFLYSSVLYADPGNGNHHPRASTAELAGLLRPEALNLYSKASKPAPATPAKDPAWHW